MWLITREFAELLSTVQRPGNFFAAGATELYPPQLEIDGVGPIALPLLPVQAEQLIAVAERAPYGRGEETLLDTSVRRTWQITPEQVHIGGRNWPRTLEIIIQHCTKGLGVSAAVSAELYKLLIYDEGSFFISHRDTEKSPGMFATLIIVLPSTHSGGELLVRHRDQQVRLDMGDMDPSEVTFAAFYADCVHEILPLTAGYRLALVYNLIRQGHTALPRPPDYTVEQTYITVFLQRWIAAKRQAENGLPEKLIYPLEHAYTPAELSFAALKGADAAAAAVLTPACEESACDLHLALLTVEESGSAEYSGYYGSRRGRWSMPSNDDFEVYEVYDQSKTLSHWQRPNGSSTEWGEMPFISEELCPPLDFEDMQPDEQYFHEATGNEGASFERTYRRAALVIWPRERKLAVLNQAGLSVTLPYLDQLTQDWINDGAKPASPLWQQAHELASHMLHTWPISSERAYRIQPSTNAKMLNSLTQLQDVEHIDTFLSTISVQGDYQQDDNPALISTVALLAKPRALALIEQIIAANALAAVSACAQLLALSAKSQPFSTHPTELASAAKTLLAALPGDPARAPHMQPWRQSKADSALLVELLNALGLIDTQLAEQSVDYILAWPTSYDLDSVVLPAVLVLSESKRDLSAVQRLREACLVHLRARIAKPLAPPNDWTRDHTLNCHCAYCSELSQFLADPAREVWTLKAAENHRKHVGYTIKQNRCDVDTKTSKQGRPYGLVCTKNQASYERRARQRKHDLKHLARLT